MFPIRLLAAGVFAVVGAGSALGQGCDTPSGCGHSPLFGTGALFAPNKDLSRRPNGNQPLCATRTYPLSDWAYIRKYCGPTLNPGSCYGHYQTKWRKWEDVCPQGGEGGCAGTTPGAMPVLSSPVQPAPSSSLMIPMPMPLPVPPTPVPAPKEPTPKQDPAPVSVAPAPLPNIPMPMPASISTIPLSPVEQGKSVGNSPIGPLKSLPNSVVPPVRDFSEPIRN